MKKYLFGLGAMLVGAGLMFVFPHTEVSAENTKPLYKEADCQVYRGRSYFYDYCKIDNLRCVRYGNAVSCVREY